MSFAASAFRPLIRLIAIELVIGGRRPGPGADVLDRLLAPIILFHGQPFLAGVDHDDFVAGDEAHLLDQLLGQPYGQAVAPFGNLHRARS
jgi:hypothetical protein